MSTRAAATAMATLAVALVGVATAAVAGERPAELGRMAATGAVELSGPGGAILELEGMRPGQSVTGTVALRNDGEAAGRLRLARTALADTPGRGGARLSQALRLRIEELGSGAPRVVYDGGLEGPSLLDFGTIAGDQGRAFRFTATLPDTGRPPGPVAGDNALQAASTQVDWTWATEAVEPTPTPTPTPAATPEPTVTPQPTATPAPTQTPVPEPTAAPAATPPPPPVVVGGGAPELTLRIPRQVVLKTKGITLFGRCDEACSVRFAAQVTTAPKTPAKARVLTVRLRCRSRSRRGRRS